MLKQLRFGFSKLLLLVMLVVGVNVWGQMTFIGSGLTQTQNFDGLPTTTTNNIMDVTRIGHNWYRSDGSTQSQTLTANIVGGTNTSSTSHGVYNCATSNASTDRAVGSVASGSGVHSIGVELKNTTGSVISSFNISGNTEKYRNGSSNAITERVLFEYSTNATSLTSGTWTAITDLDLIEPSNTNTTTSAGIDGNLAANKAAFTGSIASLTLADNASIWIRWRDTDASGTDAILALDDVSITATLAAPTGPTISTSVSSLTSFGSVNVGANSTSASFTVSGSLLTADAVIAAPSTDFQVSLNDTDFSGSVQIPFGTGTLTNVPVYVRFTPQSAGAKSGNVTVASTGATSKTVGVSGTGVGPTATLTGTLTESSLNGASFTIGLTNDSFINPLTTAQFTLNNAPSGVTIASVTYVNATTATVVLTYNDTDFDVDATTVNVTIAANQLTSNAQLTSGNITISRVLETLTQGSTLAFNEVCINTTKDLNFTLTGTVKAGTISLGAAPNMSFSLTNGSNYTTTLSFPVSAGSLNQTIYVRFEPTLAQTYTLSTTISGGSAASVQKSLTGTGINTQAAIATNAASAITGTGATLSGRITTLALCPVSTERGFVYSVTSVNNAPEVGGTGVTAQSVAGINTTTYTLAVTGLTGSTGYSVRAYVYNGSTYTYGTAQTFTTLAPPPANDLCSSPAEIVVDAAATAGTLESATLTPITNVDADDYSDVWYSFTPSCSGTHTITLSNFTGDMDIYVFDQACPTDMFTYLDYSASSAVTEIAEIIALQGTTYTIRVSAYDEPLTTFNLQVTSTASSPIVTTGAATNITSSSANVEVTVSEACGSATGARGVVYATTQNPVIGAASTAVGTGDGTFTANLTGLANSTTYYVRAYATNNTGTTYSNQVSFTTNNIDAPVADEETTLTAGGVGFTANWQEVAGATGYRLDVSTASTFNTSANATDLFFSEYVEGSSTNRYFEIYNGTGSPVNLNTYSIVAYSNGSASASSPYALSGTLAAGQTFVIQNNGATVWSGNANLSLNNSITQFTGNDVLELRKNGTAIDRIGTVGNGSSFAQDVTLRRKSSVLSPVATYNAGDWDSYETDNVSGLGAHTFDGVTGFYVSGYENKTVSGTSSAVTGLTDGNTYYYRVRAMSANGASPNSNVITATADTVFEWNGTAWSPSTPTNNDVVSIAGDYNTGESEGTFTAQQLFINSGVLTVASGTTLEIEGAVENNATGANFIVENGGNFIQNEDVDNSGNMTIFQDSNELFKLDYTFWSSPVTGQNLYAFSPATNATRFYAYGASGTESYNSITPDNANVTNNGTTNFVPGRGYLIRMPNVLTDAMTGYPENTADYSAGTVPAVFHGQFVGVPNNGTITLPYTVANGFNGVGNPYPSPINVEAFFTDNGANLELGYGIFFWRKKNDSDATSYAILSMDSYTANDGGVESPDEGEEYTYGGQQWETYFATTPDNQWSIAQGQGFFVRAATGATNIEFNNGMRQSPVGGQPFFRNANTEPVEKSKLWFNLSAPGQGFSQTSLVYNPDATFGIDFGRDARHFTTSGLTALYTFADADKLVIQSRPAFGDTDEVPLGYRVNNAGEFTITLHRTEGLFEGEQEVYLRDNVLDVLHNIKEGGYTFTTEAGTFDSRFTVVYKNGSLGTNDNVIDANSVVVYKQDNVLKVNSGAADMHAITVYDLRGRVLYSSDKINGTEYVLSNLQAQQQMLLVEINTTRGKVTKKVIY